jgi:hypothetical protein
VNDDRACIRQPGPSLPRWTSELFASAVSGLTLPAVAMLSAACAWMVPAQALAAGGKPATKLVVVADTRGMEQGLSKLIADLYNDNLILFGLLVVVTMAGMGAVLGYAFDKGMGMLGINLGKLDHHE